MQRSALLTSAGNSLILSVW